MTPKEMFSELKHRIDTRRSNPPKKKRFEKTVQTIHTMLNMADCDDEKAAILDYAINVVGRELVYSVSAELLHSGSTPDNREYVIPLGTITKVARLNCQLDGVNVVIDTYDLEKLKKAIVQVSQNGFHQELSYYTGTFYPEINLVVVENGRHHLSAAAVKNSGSAKLQVCDLKKAFPLLHTDGAYWYINDTTPWPVYDYRIAVLYELARIKYDLFPDAELVFHEREYLTPDVETTDSISRQKEEDRVQAIKLEMSKLRDYFPTGTPEDVVIQTIHTALAVYFEGKEE